MLPMDPFYQWFVSWDSNSTEIRFSSYAKYRSDGWKNAEHTTQWRQLWYQNMCKLCGGLEAISLQWFCLVTKGTCEKRPLNYLVSQDRWSFTTRRKVAVGRTRRTHWTLKFHCTQISRDHLIFIMGNPIHEKTISISKSRHDDDQRPNHSKAFFHEI